MEDPIIEEIAADVHRGWMEEKQRQGFANHPLEMCPDKPGRDWKASCPWGDAKHHTDMLPYADLDENIKDYDRATARAVFSGLKQRGYLVLHPARVKQIQALLAAEEASL